ERNVCLEAAQELRELDPDRPTPEHDDASRDIRQRGRIPVGPVPRLLETPNLRDPGRRTRGDHHPLGLKYVVADLDLAGTGEAADHHLPRWSCPDHHRVEALTHRSANRNAGPGDGRHLPYLPAIRTIELTSSGIAAEDVIAVARADAPVMLTAEALAAMERS